MPDASTLRDVLLDARRLGFTGPGDIDAAIEHARGFLGVLRPSPLVVDLGSGGGLPGLVLAVERPALEVVLVDASQRRTDALRRAVGRLGLAPRARVVHARAEDLGRDPAWRGRCQAIVARGFGAPAVLAECAAPLLVPGGQLVVSEPPVADPARWPAEPLAELGLWQDDVPSGAAYASFTLAGECPARFPRRSLRPPLFA